uniref:Ribosomal protein L32 n=1 Tax=Berberis ganpinensis TaxID=1813943 RepID=A0A6B9MPM8_9MAGN|nr:ribosomal protein L32 [Berberis ganpinensis]
MGIIIFPIDFQKKNFLSSPLGLRTDLSSSNCYIPEELNLNCTKNHDIVKTKLSPFHN